MAGRDAAFRTATDSDVVPHGMPPQCPRCRSAIDVRRFANASPPMVYLDCWRCCVTWAVEMGE